MHFPPRTWTRTLALAATLAGGIATAADRPILAESDDPTPLALATFTTVFKSPQGLEGLTGDRRGTLYSAARGSDQCPVWRAPAAGGPAVVVGIIPPPCGPAGLAFGADGDLFVASGDAVM